MSGKLEGRIAVVTGGGRGIGAQICRTFAHQGAAVAVVDIQQEAAGQITEAIERNAGQAIAVTCDVTDGDDVVGAALRTKRRVKPVYVSIGHRIDLETAIQWVMACLKGYRLPEPTRLAHLAAAGKLFPEVRRVKTHGVCQ